MFKRRLIIGEWETYFLEELVSRRAHFEFHSAFQYYSMLELA